MDIQKLEDRLLPDKLPSTKLSDDSDGTTFLALNKSTRFCTDEGKCTFHINLTHAVELLNGKHVLQDFFNMYIPIRIYACFIEH